MNRRLILVLVLVIGLGILLRLTFAVSASPVAQQPAFPSPTPQPDGRIIYIVKEGDNCLMIELLYGVSEEYLRTTNHLNENCDIVVGQQLMIGIGGPAAYTPTSLPGIATTPAEPTSVPAAGAGEVCVLMYDDRNGDALRQETEFGVADGAVSLTAANGQYSQTRTTASGIDPETEDAVLTCFTDVPEGAYTISVAVPDGYNPTTRLSRNLDVLGGDISYVAFGAQSKGSSSGGGSGASPILGVLGAFFLLAGAGLGIFAWRTKK